MDGLKNHPQWGGEHGQRRLTEAELGQLVQVLEMEAMPGTRVGSGWTVGAIHGVIVERFGVGYSPGGVRKLLHQLNWSYQRGRKLYVRRTPAEQQRFELETTAVLAEFAASGQKVVPLAGDQSKVYLEGSLSRCWNPVGCQPLVADGARSKQAENIDGAVHLGTGHETATLVADWQDSQATIAWLELILAEHPQGQILLWLDGAGHHTSETVQDWLDEHPRLEVFQFPAYTPEENPKEATWKTSRKPLLITTGTGRFPI